MYRHIALKAQRLAEYIRTEVNLEFEEPGVCAYADHIGALFTDIILQAGVNYSTVVRPRVSKVLNEYPLAYTVSRFYVLLKKKGFKDVLRWEDSVKLQRLSDLLEFCLAHEVQTSLDLRHFLRDTNNIESFKKIKGIGDKTFDYLLKLMNVDTVAVDRHIYTFVEEAGIEYSDYHEVKSIVEYAADFLGISRRCLDYSIWSYMSSKRIRDRQMCLFDNY